MGRTRRGPPDELFTIPGVGASIAADLRLLGVEKIADLRGGDPEQLYRELEDRVGHRVDRCVLYVFREAVYVAGNADPETELMKWWNWKDGGLAERRGLVAPPDTAPRSGTA